MSASRQVLVFAAIAVAVALILGSGASSTAEPGLEEQVAALSQRVAVLEADLSSLESSVRSNHPDPSLERAATQELVNITALIAKGETGAAQPQLDAFVAQYGNTRAGQKGRGMRQELTAIGRPAPEDWKVERWFQGEGDLRLDGSGPTMVVFWETWCPHCRREVPELQRTYEKYRGRGLEILTLTRLSRGSTEQSVREFIAQHGLGFPVAKDDGSLASHFFVGGIPAAAVVLDGEVIWRGHPALIGDELIESWLR